MPRLLTDRQGDVLFLLCEGMTRAEAAAALGLTPARVSTHLTRALVRLGSGTPAERRARALDDLAAAAQRARRRAETPQDETTAPE